MPWSIGVRIIPDIESDCVYFLTIDSIWKMADTMVAAPQIGGDETKTLWQQTLNTSNGNENGEETEETDNNSAKLFERSRIKALAGDN